MVLSLPLARRVLALACLAVAGLTSAAEPAATPAAPAPPAAPAVGPADAPNRVVKEGVVVELTAGTSGAALRAGELTEVRFRVTDATTGAPVRGLEPSAWIDAARALPEPAGRQAECREKIGLYLKGMVGMRPTVDLTSYFLVVMNRDPSLSVIDPVVGMTGKTSLYATVLLEKPGADWVQTQSSRLLVSMPLANKVAVVDTDRFKVERAVAAGEAPTRVALQPDGRYLWVGNDARSAAKSGVTVLDAATGEHVAFIATGRGHHELAFSGDDRYAFVTNRQDGTVSVVDVASLRKVKDLKAGPLPISIAWSSHAQALFVADGQDGSIAVVDPAKLQVVRRLAAKPGMGPMRFSQDGRWGVAVNPAEHAIHVVDASTRTLAHTVSLPGAPYQVSFTRGFAYLRLLDSGKLVLVNLASLGAGQKPSVQTIPAGEGVPRTARDLGIADTVAPATTEAAVFALNPAEGQTYYYMEGMNAASGSFGSYGHAPRAVTVVDRSVRETEPGLYTARVRLPAEGDYDVAFLLSAPRVVHCFPVVAAANPVLAPPLHPVTVRFQDAPIGRAGAPVAVAFTLTDAATGAPATGLADVRVASYVAPGDLRTETTARELGQGRYEVTLTPARAGAWYVHLAIPSLQVKYGDLPYLAIAVRADPMATGALP